MAGALVLLVDVADEAVLAAARAGLQQFGNGLCLPAQQAPAAGGAGAALPAAAPPARPVVGLCSLSKPPQSLKPVLQVRIRPGPLVLRDFHAAVGRLQPPPAEGGGGGGALDTSIAAATAATALQQLVGLVAQDAACVAATKGSTHKPVVLYLTDRADFEPDEFRPCLEVCRGKGVQMELVLMQAAQQAQQGQQQEQEGGGDASDAQAATAAAAAAAEVDASDARAAAWEAAEAAFPHLSVTIVQGASKLSFDCLASTLLQRFAGQPQLAVNLQFKQPLVGGIRSLQLDCQCEIRPLTQTVDHAVLCPCHRAPASWAGAAAPTCAISGAALDRRQCGRDDRTVQLGWHPGSALHMKNPVNIANMVGSGWGGDGSRASAAPATLNVIARIKAAQANPALLFGLPLILSAPAATAGQAGGPLVKVVHEGEVADVSTHQLLGLVCSSLSAAGEALLAFSTTDLECGRTGLFRLHYLLLPCGGGDAGAGAGAGGCRPAALVAKRLASADELAAPLLAPAAPPAGKAAAAAPLSAAVAEVVAGQLARVPLSEQLDPLALSSRCGEMIEMLMRESQPMPKVQVPPPPTAAPAAAPAVVAPAAHASSPAAAVLAAQQPAAAAPPAPAAKGRRPAAAAAASGARESGGQRAAASKQPGVGKGALEFKRSTRR